MARRFEEGQQPGESDGEPCFSCRGEGRIWDHICPSCKGAGRKPVWHPASRGLLLAAIPGAVLLELIER
jgi:hypothetical protein